MNSALTELTITGTLSDEDINLGETALLLGAVFQPDVSLDRYINHLEKLCKETQERFEKLLKAGADNSAETRLAALKHTLADKHGYEGDYDAPEHVQNADLIRVIDRGKGSPISLCILYMHVALGLGWEVYALKLPSYFVLRLDMGSTRLIFDPYDGCRILQAPDLRRLVKQGKGQYAELSADYYEPVSRREILISLQNHIKLRQIELEDYKAAVQSVEAMRAIDPDEYRLLLDAGVLYARTGEPKHAIDALEEYIVKVPDPHDRREAYYLLQEIKLQEEEE